MTPTASTETFATARKASIETFQALAASAIDQTERLTTLNLNIARSLAEDFATSAQAMLTADDIPALFKLQADRLQPRMDRTVGYTQSVAEIAVDAQRGFSTLAQDWLADASEAFHAALADASKSSGSGPDAVFTAMRSAMGIAGELYDKLNRSGAEVAAAVGASLSERDTGIGGKPVKGARNSKATTPAAAGGEA